MKIIETPELMAQYRKELASEWKSVGFVPTMGALHEGHLSLVRASREENDHTVVSIFVNPTQFGPGEDYDKYPRDLDADRELLEKEGADVIFLPTADAVYPPGYSTYVVVEGLTGRLCGSSRPTHFRGVTTVVAKLIQMVRPHRAYFGQKDAQQAVVIKRMVKDLLIPVEIRVCPIVRESDGLAMSSRNQYLSREERRAAPSLYRGLERARDLAEAGEKDVSRILTAVQDIISSEPLVELEYLEAVDAETLTPLEKLDRPVLIALAAGLGKTRLIDNVVLSGRGSAE